MDTWRTAHAVSLLAARHGRTSPGRLAYLILTIGATVATWLVLSAMASPYLTPTGSATTSAGILVKNARSPQMMLPIKYADRITALPGVRDIVYSDLTLLYCPAGKNVTINAWGGSGAARRARDLGFASAAVQRWVEDPLGVLVGSETAALCGWQAGDTVSPLDVFLGRPREIHIVGVAPKDAEQVTKGALAHYTYINRTSVLAGEGRALFFRVAAIEADEHEAVAVSIQAEFKHAAPPVTAYPDSLAVSARTRFGKVQYLLGLVMVAVFLCCLLVLGSVFAHAASERRAQLALLRVMGFPRRVLLSSFILEALAVAAAGTALGLLAGGVLLQYLPAWLNHMFGELEPAPWTWWLLPVWLVVLLGVSLAMPATLVMRVAPMDSNAD